MEVRHDEVPDFYRRLWRLPAAPQRKGRKSTLDVDTVVDMAVRLADTGGLESATLPKVAKALDVTPMSLYRHIGSKQELLLLMVEAASTPPSSQENPAEWRAGIREWAAQLWALYRGRPWLPRVPVYNPPAGPHQLAWLEHGLAQLADTPLGWETRLSAITLLSGYVRHSALLAQELEEGLSTERSPADAEGAYADALGALVSARDFPNVASMLASEALTGSRNAPPSELTTGFSAGLEVILDGLAARIRGTAPPILDHLSVSVQGYPRAKEQFRPVLAALGFEEEPEVGDSVAWYRDGETEFIIMAARDTSTSPHQHGRVGWQHLAFALPSPSDVDRLHAIAVEVGWNVVRDPKHYPRFSSRYYASFVEEDSGIRIEFMYNPPQDAG